MGQEQGKPIDRDSQAYKEAQQRFTTVTRAEDVVRELQPDEAEAARLMAMLNGLQVMDPLLKSSLQSHILTSKAAAAAAELGGVTGPNNNTAQAQQAAPTGTTAVVGTPTSAEGPSALPSSSTVHVAPISTADVCLQGKGLKEAPLISVLARAQTADHRTTTEMVTLQEDILSRLNNIKYNAQYLKYRASQVSNDVMGFSRAVAAEEAQMGASLREMEGLTADIVGLMGMIEHLGDELEECEAGEEAQQQS